MRYIVILLLFASCRSPKEIQKEQERAEQTYIGQIIGRNADKLLMAPPITIPGGMILKEVAAPCEDFDIGSIKSKGGQLSVNILCPDTRLNVDSIIRSSGLYQAAVLLYRSQEITADSLARELAVSKSDNTTLKNQRNKAIGAFTGLIGIVVVVIAFKFRTGLFSGLKRLFS